MSKLQLESQIVTRVAGPLRAELDAAAQEAGEDLSALVRRVLGEWAAARIIVRSNPVTAQPMREQTQ